MLHRKGQKENWTDLSLLGQEPTFNGNKHSSYNARFFSVTLFHRLGFNLADIL